MQKLESRMRAAMQKYAMLADGDRVAVGVSGGKDSLAMLVALAQMRRYYPKRYELEAISLDMGFGEGGADWTDIRALCASLGVPHTVKQTSLAKIVFEYRREDNPCSLCAKMRRGALHDLAKEVGCNTVALGHHMDDAAETFLMNLLSGGRVECFRPVTYLSRKELRVIRPMVLAREGIVSSAAKHRALPVMPSLCPMDGQSERQRMKELLNTLERQYPHLREKIVGALERGNISGWGADDKENIDEGGFYP